MRLGLLVVSAAAGLGLAAACTTEGTQQHAANGSASGQCFFPSQVTGFTQAGRDRINVQTGPRDVYQFEVMPGCSDLQWAEGIGFDHTGSSTICQGLDVTLIVPTSIGPRRCPVRMIRKLEPAGQ